MESHARSAEQANGIPKVIAGNALGIERQRSTEMTLPRLKNTQIETERGSPIEHVGGAKRTALLFKNTTGAGIGRTQKPTSKNRASGSEHTLSKCASIGARRNTAARQLLRGAVAHTRPLNGQR
jgi:hypothetical protein